MDIRVTLRTGRNIELSGLPGYQNFQDFIRQLEKCHPDKFVTFTGGVAVRYREIELVEEIK